MARGMRIEDMPIFGIVPGIDRVFVYGNPKDDMDLKQLISNSRPTIVFVDEDVLKERGA